MNVVFSLAAATAIGFLPGGWTAGTLGRGQPNPPRWPETVHLFGPGEDAKVRDAVAKVFEVNGGQSPPNKGEFSSLRFAFLFKPGIYVADIPVGYYTQIIGLGRMPREVIFRSKRGIYCEEGDQRDLGGALSTFWRGAENFWQTQDMLWAVSQAAPLRRVVIDGDLHLAQFVPNVGMGYSSGGFIGNSEVRGKALSSSQQQWCTRNADLAGGWPQANWNMVFIGTKGAPPSHCGRTGNKGPTVNVEQSPVIAEKPFISIDNSGRFQLNVPEVKHGRVGPDYSPGKAIDFSDVYVATANSSAEINRHLQQGLHVVLSPGIYYLKEPLLLNFRNQVLLGLGYATLVPISGTAAIQVGNVDGVRIAGVLLQAGTGNSDTLLQWGDGSYLGNSENPGFLHDVFARVGGPDNHVLGEVRSVAMVRIDSGHVIGDNLWLWRADHSIAGLVKQSQNPCDHGLVVTGAHVTMYGLAVEHTLKDLVQWSGEDGATYFFQAELPYDVTQEFGNAGYVGYRVLDTVRKHKAFGVGVYHFFRDHEVSLRSAIKAPHHLEDFFHTTLAVYLAGRGHLEHVLNDQGHATGKDATHVEWLCSEPSVPNSGPHRSSLGQDGHCVEGYGQCGGQHWKRPTCCVPGFSCSKQNKWYSRCIPLQTASDSAAQGQKQLDIQQKRSRPAATTSAQPAPTMAESMGHPQPPWRSQYWPSAGVSKLPSEGNGSSLERGSPHSMLSSPPNWLVLLLTLQGLAICALAVVLGRLKAMVTERRSSTSSPRMGTTPSSTGNGEGPIQLMLMPFGPAQPVEGDLLEAARRCWGAAVPPSPQASLRSPATPSARSLATRWSLPQPDEV